MPRSRRDDDDRPQAQASAPSVGLLLAGIAAGVACAVVLLVGWLAFRQPAESQEKMRQREAAEYIQNNKSEIDRQMNAADSLLHPGRGQK